MNFGQAIDVLKTGGRVARTGWNGKNMFLFLEKGSFPYGPRPDLVDGVDSDLFDFGDSGTVPRMPHISMQAASGATVTGWLASQTDILADDWKELISVEVGFDMMVDPDDVLRATDEDLVDRIIAAMNGVGEKAEVLPFDPDHTDSSEEPESTLTFSIAGEVRDPGDECNCVACHIGALLKREGVI